MKNQYKLINRKTNEEHFCEKITVDGYDYYVSDSEQPKIDGELYHCKNKGKGIDVGYGQPSQVLIINKYISNRNLCSDCKKIIATNSPNIDLPQILNEVTELSSREFGLAFNSIDEWKNGFNKAKELYPNSDSDMIEFHNWYREEDNAEKYANFSDESMLNFWKENVKTITLYYE